MYIEGKLTNLQKKAINYFADKLFSHQLKRNLSVRVIIRRKPMKVYGLAEIVSYNTSGRARDFLIEINGSLSVEDKLRTLAHEMIHVKQYAYDELNCEMTMWRGKEVDADKIPYAQQPWEIEAWTKGDRLYRSFMNGHVRLCALQRPQISN